MRAIEDIMNCKKIAWKHVADDGASGTYYTHKWTGSIIFSTGAGWEHVSVAPFKRSVTPSWDDMCEIKNIFWGEDEAVIEVHTSKDEYVNNKENCLHLWRCTYKEMVLPPSILVGIKESMSAQEFMQKLKEAYEMAGEEFPE